jgi:hypothetical protein
LSNNTRHRDIAAILILCAIGLFLCQTAKRSRRKISTASRLGRVDGGTARDMVYLGMVLRAFLLFHANVLPECASCRRRRNLS